MILPIAAITRTDGTVVWRVGPQTEASVLTEELVVPLISLTSRWGPKGSKPLIYGRACHKTSRQTCGSEYFLILDIVYPNPKKWLRSKTVACLLVFDLLGHWIRLRVA